MIDRVYLKLNIFIDTKIFGEHSIEMSELSGPQVSGSSK